MCSEYYLCVCDYDAHEYFSFAHFFLNKQNKISRVLSLETFYHPIPLNQSCLFASVGLIWRFVKLSLWMKVLSVSFCKNNLIHVQLCVIFVCRTIVKAKVCSVCDIIVERSHRVTSYYNRHVSITLESLYKKYWCQHTYNCKNRNKKYQVNMLRLRWIKIN